MRRFLCGIALVAAASAAPAQVIDGRILFCSTLGVFHAAPDLSTSANHPGFLTQSGIQTVRTAWGNGAFIGGTAAGLVLRVTSMGTTTTIASFPSGVTSIALDQDANYLFGTSASGVIRMSTAGGTPSTFGPYGAAAISGICRNLDNGRFGVLTTSPALLYETDRAGTTTTLASLAAGPPTGICYMPDTNRYAVTYQSTATPLQFVTAAGTIAGSIYMNGQTGASCTYDPISRQLYVGTGAGFVYRLSNAGSIVNSLQSGVGAITGIDVYDDQNISVNSSGASPSTASVKVTFAASVSSSYCLALSFGLRPALGIPGAGFLNLRAEPLFFLTACTNLPGLTTRFVSTVNAAGEQGATFRIIGGLPSGTRYYVSGAAVNPSLPGGLDIGNTELVIVP